jgi:hypothetical protein
MMKKTLHDAKTKVLPNLICWSNPSATSLSAKQVEQFGEWSKAIERMESRKQLLTFMFDFNGMLKTIEACNFPSLDSQKYCGDLMDTFRIMIQNTGEKKPVTIVYDTMLVLSTIGVLTPLKN